MGISFCLLESNYAVEHNLHATLYDGYKNIIKQILLVAYISTVHHLQQFLYIISISDNECFTMYIIDPTLILKHYQILFIYLLIFILEVTHEVTKSSAIRIPIAFSMPPFLVSV